MGRYSNGMSGIGDWGDEESLAMFDENQQRRSLTNQGELEGRNSMGLPPHGQVLPVPAMSMQDLALAHMQQLNEKAAQNKQLAAATMFDSKYQPNNVVRKTGDGNGLFNALFNDGTGNNTSAQQASQLTQGWDDQSLSNRRAMEQKQMTILQALNRMTNAMGDAGPDEVAAFHNATVRSNTLNSHTQELQKRREEQQKQEAEFALSLAQSYGHQRPGSSGVPSYDPSMGIGAEGTAEHAMYLSSRGVHNYGIENKNSWEAINATNKQALAQQDSEYQNGLAQIQSILDEGARNSARQKTYDNSLGALKVAMETLGLGAGAQAAAIKAEAPKPAFSPAEITAVKTSIEGFDKKIATLNAQIKTKESDKGMDPDDRADAVKPLKNEILRLEHQRDAMAAKILPASVTESANVPQKEAAPAAQQRVIDPDTKTALRPQWIDWYQKNRNDKETMASNKIDTSKFDRLLGLKAKR